MVQTLRERAKGMGAYNPAGLKAICRGVEKEGLRFLSDGTIAQSDHPVQLGSALTHPQITTDYSEALLELITPVHNDISTLCQDLETLHKFVYSSLPEDEMIWAGSMPTRLEGNQSIRIAEYGKSNLGKLKHVYRRGLDYRYGRIMQSIAGAHFNFSLADSFWLAHKDALDDKQSLQAFKTESYFSIIRNFRRWQWLLVYLFGASPVLDKSFFNGHKPDSLVKVTDDTYGLPYATSLRMSDLGYQNNAQSSLEICFNHLDTYIKTLFDATHTPYPAYEKIGVKQNGEYVQLNTSLLQIENEYYNTIRPKRVTDSGEKPLQALQRRGIEYIEVRCLDLDPFSPIGLNVDQLHFMDVFLITCLLSESPLVNDLECRMIDNNFAKTVTSGRDPQCLLSTCINGECKSVSVKSYGECFLEEALVIAAELDKAIEGDFYSKSVEVMAKRLAEPEETPSAKVYAEVGQTGYVEWMKSQSLKHKQFFSKDPISSNLIRTYQRMTEQSWQNERQLEEQNQIPFDEYLQQYMLNQ